MELVVTVVGKEIKQDKTSFVAYALLSATGKWYRVAGIEGKELAPFNKKVAVVSVSRRFDKDVIGADGMVRKFPTLVVTSVRKPNESEEKTYSEALDKINAATLADVN